MFVWCLWRERNTQSFDDCETRLLDLKKLVLHTQFTWKVAWDILLVSTFSKFLDLCFLSLWVRGSLVYFMCIGLQPYGFE